MLRTDSGAGFNEAGAINAGKRDPEDAFLSACRSFNEAGAINAGKHMLVYLVLGMVVLSFNEAGAINAGKLHQVLLERRQAYAVSMRPAQLTPENDGVQGRVAYLSRLFQ